jgi:hypothetical protein
MFWLHRVMRYGRTCTEYETGRMDHEMRYWWTWISALAVPYSAGPVSSACRTPCEDGNTPSGPCVTFVPYRLTTPRRTALQSDLLLGAGCNRLATPDIRLAFLLLVCRSGLGPPRPNVRLSQVATTVVEKGVVVVLWESNLCPQRYGTKYWHWLVWSMGHTVGQGGATPPHRPRL